MRPEDLLHLFGPYLPTDRFRALLRHSELPTVSRGAALLVDISGFTPFTRRLVAEVGAQKAGEELKGRINPMFEAIAGQVFLRGGSVIRFTGDGFTAWFDDRPTAIHVKNGSSVPGVLRALSAGLEMQVWMQRFRKRLFPDLRLKVCIGIGTAQRWVVGQPNYGLTDLLSGPAVEAMISLAGEVQPDQVLIHSDAIALLRQEKVKIELAETGNAIVLDLDDPLATAVRQYRWPPWTPEGDANDILDAVRPFVTSTIREQIETGIGDFVGELRYALPMFIQFSYPKPGIVDPRASLDTYIRSVQHVLATHGGRLVSVEVSDKGNVVFAVFGAPVTHGDDALHALTAAISLRDEAARMETIVAQRIGISRGLLYAGIIGGEVRHEYSTIGDETNIAARLMVSAAAGQILTTSAVRKEVGSRIVFQDLQPITVKGWDESIPVAEPLTVRAGGSRRSHAGKFVGRETEMALLDKLVKTVKRGRPRILRLEGQAGIGKSRMVAEMTRNAIEDDFRIAGGDCISTGQQTAYLPWREIITSLFNLSTEADADSAVRQLRGVIESQYPEWLSRWSLLRDPLRLPIADTPTTAKMEGRTRRQATFALITEIILRLAHQQPLLLILEDVQWMDEVSEALTIDLTRRLGVEPAPLLLVLIHRPLLDHDHAVDLIQALKEMHFHHHLVLDEMNRADVYTMIEKHLDANVPPELSHFVYERAQGNPFFVQEVLDTLLETNRIKVAGSRVVITGALQAADLPRTVQGLIQARIDRLNEIDKLVLKVAAVIGREFSVRILAASIPIQMSYPQLLQHLQSLEARDFSHLAEPEPELSYLFKHAITQEVTYQSLPFAQRRQLHQAVATTLEIIAPDAIERLAHHFAHSGDRDRARQYLIRAGEKAFRGYANQAALDYFTQALDKANTDAERFDIARQQVQVMLRLGDMAAARAQLLNMQNLAADSKHIDWQAHVHLFWADYYTQTSAWSDANREAQIAVKLAEQIADDTLAWSAYRLLQSTYLSLNQRREAEQLDVKLQVLSERLGDTRYAIELVLTWFDDLYTQSPEIAIHSARTALQRAEELHEPVLEADCWGILADFYARENNLLAALDAFRQRIGLARQIGDRRIEGLTLNRIGIVLINLGQFSEAGAHLNDAYRILHQIGERSGEATSLVYLGVIAEHRKSYEEAIAYLLRGLEAQQNLNAAPDAALTLFHMGNCYLAKGHLDAALKTLNEARAILVSKDTPRRLDEIEIALAEIDLRRGDCETARRRINSLLPRLRQQQLSNLFLPGLAYWRVVQILRQCGYFSEAAELRAAFKAGAEGLLSKIEDQVWRDAYRNNIWYHAALLNE